MMILNKLMTVTMSIALVITSQFGCAFSGSYLVAPGMAEISNIAKQELEQRRELLNQVVQQLQSKNLPVYLKNFTEFLRHLKIVIKPDIFKFTLSWGEEEWRDELISICAELDKWEFENDIAKGLILQAKRIIFYKQIAEETVEFFEQHSDEAMLFLLGVLNTKKTDISLCAHEVKRRLDTYGIDIKIRARNNENSRNGYQIWILAEGGFIIEISHERKTSDQKFISRILHTSENMRNEYVHDKDLKGMIDQLEADMKPWDVMAEKLETEDKLQHIDNAVSPFVEKYKKSGDLVQKYTDRGTFVPTPYQDTIEMFKEAGLEKGKRFFSLGSGLGHDVFIAASIFYAHAVGMEYDPELFKDSCEAHGSLKKESIFQNMNVSLKEGDYLLPDVDLSQQDLLYWYYNQKTHVSEGESTNAEALQLKIIDTQFKPGTKLVVYGGSVWYGFNLRKRKTTEQGAIYYIYEANENGYFTEKALVSRSADVPSALTNLPGDISAIRRHIDTSE